MKTNITARVTCLFIFKTAVMVNKRKKSLLYNFYFRQTAIFRFTLFFYFPYLFRFNFVVSERNVHSFLPAYLSGTFYSGGGCTCTQCTPPPCVRACQMNKVLQRTIVYTLFYTRTRKFWPRFVALKFLHNLSLNCS